jgi:predicted Zn-dependent peptidase
VAPAPRGGGTLQDLQAPAFFKGSRYLDRTPIGTPESIRGFKQERLRQFYTDWLPARLMAVIAVGDFDPAKISAAIERQFGASQACRPAARAQRSRRLRWRARSTRLPSTRRFRPPMSRFCTGASRVKP